MSYSKKFLVAVAIAFLSHFVSQFFFEGVVYLAHEDLTSFRQGPPWCAVFKVALGLLVVASCFMLKGTLYRQNRFARIAALGLLAAQYLSIALVHGSYSPPEIAVALFAVALLVWVFFAARKLEPDVYDRQRLDPKRVPEPEARPGLILFLSFLTGGGFRGPATNAVNPESTRDDPDTEGWANYKKDVLKIVESIKNGPDYKLTNENLLKPFGPYNIRMPLEAIRFQLATSQLTDVILIPSIDTPRRDPASGELLPTVPYSGSHGQTGFFAAVVKELFADLTSIPLRVVAVPGADFEDETQISRAIADARRILAKNGAGLHNIDVTGGQAICSVVAAAKCLGENDRFTYVSTRDYRSRSYDFVVEPPPEIG